VEFNTWPGYISHKYGMNYDPNERCVWTIRLPYATGYRFNISGLEITDPEDGISISTLKRVDNTLQNSLVM
jgi:hypothetical protein